MEILKQACDGAGKAGLFVCCATCLAIPTVFATFLGIYAYNNPDQQAWYGIVDGKQQLFADPSEAGSNMDLVDIHSRFQTWFHWGFISMVALPVNTLLMVLFMFCNATLGNICCCSCIFVTGSTSLAWFISGLVWRFRQDGAFAAGDYEMMGKTKDEWEAIVTAEDSLY